MKKEHATGTDSNVLSQVNYSDLVLWREGKIFHQGIQLDDNFIDDTFQKAETFVKLLFCHSSLANGLANKMPGQHVQTKTLLLLTFCQNVALLW